VPPEPSVPGGARDVVVFRAAPNYYRYKLTLWVLVQLGALAGLVVGTFFAARVFNSFSFSGADFLFRLIEFLAWAGFLVQLVFGFALLRLDFEMRWYVVSDRSLRIREGILSLQEKTLTYANIQNISIRQNPLQRILGLSDVQVKTAGGGGAGADSKSSSGGEATHEAWFRGVDNAEAIRSIIRARVRLHRDSGLGDLDEPEPLPPDSEFSALTAARELRDEVRSLRRVLGSGSDAPAY
jgi:membrane protein YdbS with pleckstrin-like domain